MRILSALSIQINFPGSGHFLLRASVAYCVGKRLDYNFQDDVCGNILKSFIKAGFVSCSCICRRQQQSINNVFCIALSSSV
jgi:hypothetical protein